MTRVSVFCFALLGVILTGSVTMPPRFFSAAEPAPRPAAAVNDPENGQRWIFTLQYIAGDYDRAVQNGQIVDSLEYSEMQRFAHTVATAYQSAPNMKKPTAAALRKLEDLIAAKAEAPAVRALCHELAAVFIKEMNLIVFPRFSPDLANGEKLFGENCATCHGDCGAGDGPSADTLNPKPRDFTDPQRLQKYAPYQFFQALTFGVEGTAMAAFGEAFTPEERWDLAFYLMTLRRDFRPEAPAADPQLTLKELATHNNRELAALLTPPGRVWRHPLLELTAIIDYARKNPPQPTTDEYLAITERLLKQSLAAYARGDSAQANLFAYDAYWQGFEMIEGKLQYSLYNKFERIFGDYNTCIEKAGQLKQAQALMKMLLDILQHIRQGKGWRS